MPPIGWGPADAILIRPVDNVALIQHALTVLHRTRIPPDHPCTKSVVPAAPIAELGPRPLAGLRPLVANGTREVFDAVVAPLTSVRTVRTLRRASWNLASSRSPAQFNR